MSQSHFTLSFPLKSPANAKAIAEELPPLMPGLFEAEDAIGTINGNNLSKSVTWTDFVLGARFSMPLSSKASVDVLGDAGEGGATLDYQVGGLLNYQVKPKWTLQGGWRYLTVHYGNNGNIFNSSIQGILIGATYKFK